MKRMRVFAGPPGSGKSTMVNNVIEEGRDQYSLDRINPNRHINLDEINSNDVLDFSKYGLTIDENDFRDFMLQSPVFKYCNINIEDFKINNNCFTIPKMNMYIGSMLADYLRDCYIKSAEPLFSYETVFSHHSHVDFIKRAKDSGWQVYLYFIGSSDPYINCGRVEERVLNGKHDVPRDKIIERYTRALDNLFPALQHCTRAYIFDNSTEMQLIAEKNPNGEIELYGNSIPLWLYTYLISNCQKEIQEKAKIACKESIETPTKEITYAIREEVKGWEIGPVEDIELQAEDLLKYLNSSVPNFFENKHIIERIKEIEDKKNLVILLKGIRDLFEELPKIMIDPKRTRPTIGIITALPKEYAAVFILLENKNDKYKIPGQGAGRRYCLGEILSEEGIKHNLVLTTVGMGNNIASTRASLLLEHFPNVKSIIMVGIAGGVPNPSKDKVDDHVRLGDIVVSNEYGVIQYDFIKQEIQDITYRTPPRSPSASLLEAVRYLEAEEIVGNCPWEKYIDQALSQLKIHRPSEDKDILYDSENQNKVVSHPEDPKRVNGQPRVFIGPIASANVLQKDPNARDKLHEKFRVKAIEMEASGIADATWNHEVGYLVVRGICDYCDSHKNDDWQQYAAVVAAAYTRALIESMP